ncbi:PP2C family protein-serine/threonine phosphatase [Glycomyces harbinensis]|uniref:Stage II sporulation protein E (SpoIIE) n=1 Tax=Glycomyces harbinensis TaxID=58114 RepID=A0A1G6SI58_9ACTN|nr:PP2C family protein-serine/threonine phosphatase [Glycomyces harbinensis]SDD16354.1 Stage II sporulation protein E (SpoIIE) [Glycomyces harbinensis]
MIEGMERLPEMLGLRGTAGLAWLRVIPLLLVVVLAPLEILATSVHLWAVIAAMPPMAALVNGPRTTALVAVAAVAACLLLSYTRAGDADPTAHGELVTVILIGGTSVLIAVLRDRMLARLLSVNSVAEAAQRALLPDLPGRIAQLECATAHRPSTADSRLGGDFFDMLNTPWGVRAVLGDVSGHGLGAVATMASLLGSFREGALDDVDLNALSVRLERRMGMCNERRGGWTEEFATALLMVFDPGGTAVEVRSFGHHPPLLIRGREVAAICVAPSPPLGLVGEFQVKATSVGLALRPADLVLAYTDGLTEARDLAGGMYPLEQRLRERLSGGALFAHPAEVVDFLFADLKSHGFRLTDDAAVLAVGVLPE